MHSAILRVDGKTEGTGALTARPLGDLEQESSSEEQGGRSSPLVPAWRDVLRAPGRRKGRLQDLGSLAALCALHCSGSSLAPEAVRPTRHLMVAPPHPQEIDGKALLLLRSDMMMKYMGLKLGPALKLSFHIDRLKQGKF